MLIAYALSSTTSSFPNGLIAPILDDSGSIPFGCSNDTSITSEAAQDKILLVKRGHCTFDEKIANAKDVGAIGVLFYDPDATLGSVVVAKTEADSLPCAGIDLKLANRILDHHKTESSKEPIRIEFPDEKKVIYSETAGRISDFSSTGPTYELDLKPTITGIGGDVYSTLPLAIDGWGVRSGTSMAAPHVAGTAALLISYYSKQDQNVTSKFIVEQLQNHGKLITSGNGTPVHPIIQGAGLVQRKIQFIFAFVYTRNTYSLYFL
jgi:subtilisin family serine protease